MTALPRVSVVLPVKDGAPYLAAAIESVLSQDVLPFEVIVADDGSKDDSAAIAARAGPLVRVLPGPFGGAAAARNAGTTASRGDVLAFLDHDDLWTPKRLSSGLDTLLRSPAADLVLGKTQRIRTDDGHVVPLGAPFAEMSLGAALITRKTFDLVGPFDARRRFDEDVDWFLRAREAGVSIRLQPEVVQFYRRHAGNATNDRTSDKRGFFAAIRDSAARRRGEGA